MKAGVIGCGGMGVTHYLSLKALTETMDLEVTALADCREEFLKKAADHFPEARTYKDGMELLEKEQLDMVHICLPSHLHADYAIAAMERKMNVLVEKPLCLSAEDAERILEAEKRTGVKAMIGQVVRFFEEYRYLKEVYETKKYGKLKSIVMRRLGGDVTWGYGDWFHDEKKSGSVVLDLHVHDIDFLRYLLGEPESFTVKAAAFDSGMINQIVTSYEFDGVFAVAEGLWDVSPGLPFQASYRACFEEGTVIYDGTQTPSVRVYKKDGTTEIPELCSAYHVESDAAGINISNLGPYYTEIRYFAECVRDGEAVETASLAEGAKSVELALREWKAAREYIDKKSKKNV